MRHPLLRPRWVVLHVIIAVAVPLFVLAGFWQLHRLDERRAQNRTITTRETIPARPLDDVLDADDPSRRNVRATGRYDTSEEVVLIGRPGPNGVDGSHVLTPFVADDGAAVLVDRGWVPPGKEDPPVADAEPPDDDVTITGVLFPTEGNPALSSGGTHGELVDRIDVATLATGSDHRFATTAFYVVLQAQDPPQDDLPRIVEPRKPGEGPHLGYAVQWFLFVPTLIAVYVALLRQQVKRAGRESD